MKVLKFGGTSVGTTESLKCVKDIIESEEEQIIVVVSALGGITDLLISTAELAASGDDYLDNFHKIKSRHDDIIANMIAFDKREALMAVMSSLFDELGNIYRGVSLIKDLSQSTLDMIVSYGERLSSLIISRLIDNADLFDSRNFIKTKRSFDKHLADMDLTNEPRTNGGSLQ